MTKRVILRTTAVRQEYVNLISVILHFRIPNYTAIKRGVHDLSKSLNANLGEKHL